MTWRKWLVRGLVLLIASGLAAGVLLYLRFTDSDAVRAQVMEKLTQQLRNTSVNLDSAHLRLLGGISLSELRLSRVDDPEKIDYLYVPQAIIFHDKEQLLDGVLRIRKLELYRPRFHIIRGADGRWNIGDIFAKVSPNEPIPTIVIKQGTVVIEDRRGGRLAGPPLEIKDVNLTLINDPQSALAFAGSATSDIAGPVQVTGTWQRITEDTQLSLEAPAIPIGRPLFDQLAVFAPGLGDEARSLEGQGNLHADLTFAPGAARAWGYDVHFSLKQGKFSHEKLPLPLEQIDASVHLKNNSLTLEHLDARAGKTTVHLSFDEMALTEVPRWEMRFHKLEARVEHLEITSEVFARLPEGMRHLYDDFSPGGAASLALSLEQRPSAGGWHKHCVVHPEDGRAMVKEFPYVLEHITGSLVYDADSTHPETLRLDVTGYTGDRPIHVEGQVVGHRPDHTVDVWVCGDDIPLDRKLIDALKPMPPEYYKLARELHPTGKANFKSHIRRDPQAQRFLNEHFVKFHDATVCYGKFPYPLENVSGSLEIRPGSWEFRDFVGSHKGGVFRVAGHPEHGPEGTRMNLHLEGTNVLLDDELRDAQKQRQLQKVWRAFNPAGRVNFTCEVVLNPEKKTEAIADEEEPTEPIPDIDLTVLPQGCSVQPDFFAYALTDLRGRLHYADHWLTIDNLQARHGDSRWSLGTGYVLVPPQGGFYLDFRNLQASPLFPDEAIVRALPEKVSKCWEALALHDPLAVVLWRFVIAQDADPAKRPVVYWDGALGLRDATINIGIPLEHVTGELACRGIHKGDQLGNVIGNMRWKEVSLFNQPLRNITGHLTVKEEAPEVLCINDLQAGWFGGMLYGPMRIEFGHPLRYELRLMASDVQLAEFGRHNFGENAQMSGLASADLYLSGQGADLNTLKGSGSIDVPDGKIKELPVLLDMLKVVGLRPPDRTAFEEAHLTFDIQGQHVQFNRLNLLGNAISLRGQGGMDLHGNDINLEFHADWARVPDVLPAPLKYVQLALNDQLLLIKVRGKLGDVHITKEPVPALVSPLKKVLHEFRPSQEKPPPGGTPARPSGG